MVSLLKVFVYAFAVVIIVYPFSHLIDVEQVSIVLPDYFGTSGQLDEEESNYGVIDPGDDVEEERPLWTLEHGWATSNGAANRGPSSSSDLGVVSTTAEVFDDVYQTGHWGDGGEGSGEGSRVSTTNLTRYFLSVFCREHNVRSFVDMPCGMMVWQRHWLTHDLVRQHPLQEYLGFDIARTAVQSDIAKAEPVSQETGISISIRQADMTSRDDFDSIILPDIIQSVRRRLEQPTDSAVILIRDVLQHLSQKKIWSLFQNLRRLATALEAASSENIISRIHLLLGHYYDRGVNADIEDGGLFEVNLRMPPFCEVFGAASTENWRWFCKGIPKHGRDVRSDKPGVLYPEKWLLVLNLHEFAEAWDLFVVRGEEQRREEKSGLDVDRQTSREEL